MKSLFDSWLGVMLGTLLLILILIGCGDDDDDDNSSVLSDDDSSNDDDAPDDDDSSDDDDFTDDDDDSVDYSLEPLAVLSCQAGCLEPGQSAEFDGLDSTDPSGSLLQYLIDFGDGQTTAEAVATHGFDSPGAYKISLTVTNDIGLSDRTSCIVSVGDFPHGAGTIDRVDFRPNFYDPSIKEQIDQPEHGGLLLAFFTAPTAVTIDGIFVNGFTYEGNSELLEWCEIVDETLQAGQIGILRCHSYSADLDPGQPLQIELKSGSSIVWSIDTTVPEVSLTPSLIVPSVNDDEIIVHVRNDSLETIEVDGLSIDGLDVSDFTVIENPVLTTGEIAMIRIPRCDGIDFGIFTVFTVHGNSAAKGDTSVARALRLFHPYFGIGDWNNGDIFEEVSQIQAHLDRGVNTFIYGDFAGFPPDEVLALAETMDFYVWTHKSSIEGNMADFVADYCDHPRLLGNAVSGEGDLGSDDDPDKIIRTLDRVRENRAAFGVNKPLWIYNACSNYFSAWAPLADIGGMDHYCVWRPKCNSLQFPPFNWDYIERSGQYAWVIKRNVEPSPAWNWTQGPNTGTDGKWASPEEIRSQWYSVLAHGTKSMFWFQWKERYENDAPVESNDEVERVALELRQMEVAVLEGDVATTDIVATSDHDQLQIRANVSPHEIVIFLNNLWYNFQFLISYQWQTRRNLSIDLYPPAGFEPAQFLMLDGDTFTELEWEKLDQGHWRFFVPELQVSAAIRVLPEP